MSLSRIVAASKRGPKWTVIQKNRPKITRLVEKGFTLEEIAEEIGVNSQYIRYKLQDWNIKPPSKKTNQDMVNSRAEIERQMSLGVTPAQIAQDLDISYSMLTSYLRSWKTKKPTDLRNHEITIKSKFKRGGTPEQLAQEYGVPIEWMLVNLRKWGLQV